MTSGPPWSRTSRSARGDGSNSPSICPDVETGWPARYADGDLTPPDYIAEWSAMVLPPLVVGGRSRTRVRVVDEPETDFQRWADWAAELNRAGGEVIHRITRNEAIALDLVGDPLIDWWLIDHSAVLILNFTAGGELYRVDLDDSTETLAHCRRVRAGAMEAVGALQ